MKRLPVTLSYKYDYPNFKREEMPRQIHEAVKALFRLGSMGITPVNIPRHVTGKFTP